APNCLINEKVGVLHTLRHGWRFAQVGGATPDAGCEIGSVIHVPAEQPIPAALHDRPFRLADATEMGVSRSQLRGARYSTPFRGIHVVGRLSELDDLCCAARAVLPSAAVFCDETAAALFRLPLPRAVDISLQVATPSGAALVRRRGIVGHIRDLPVDDVTTVDGLPVTTAARTFVDLAAKHQRAALVALGDAILRAGYATVAEIGVVVDRSRRRRGVRLARQLLDLLNGRAESPMESVIRLLLVDGGLPTPEVNVNVYDGYGDFLARADLLFRAARIIIEYEGDHHRTDKGQFAHDVRRGSRLAVAGYLVLRFTADDVLRRPHYVVATVKAAFASRISAS
ncbi:MAG: DUF559 domain-containing protein, partial [Acidothermaceae bacterium]